jgi:hypothetical protein
MSMERDGSFTLDGIKSELLDILSQNEFDWVSLAIDTKFVYTSRDLPSQRFETEELVKFTDTYNWMLINHVDGRLTNKDKEKLKGQIRELGIEKYGNIFELMDSQELYWLPFEVKHGFKTNFGEMLYTNQDIIYYLKIIVWDYFFPNALDADRLISIEQNGIQALKKQINDDGWVDMDYILTLLSELYSGIDLFELSKVNWGKTVEHKNHYRNPFTLGFKRYKKP